MRDKKITAFVLVALTACAGLASAQISMPSGSTALGLPVSGQTQAQVPGIVTLGEAAMASNSSAKDAPAASAAAAAALSASATSSAKAAAAPTAGASAPQVAPQAIAPSAANVAPSAPTAQPGPIVTNLQQSTTPLPSPIPTVIGAATRPRPDIELVRISTKNGVQQATLSVHGMTRSGLTVGSKVLKQVISEFRDDGVCLDTSLHKPKCANFITGNN